MAAEIYTKRILYLNGMDYEVGESIPYLRWTLDDETENEMYEAYILDITKNSILVYSLFDGSPANDVEINIDDIAN